MRIALVLKQKEKNEVDGRISQAVVFDVEEDKVVGVENEAVEAGNLTSLSLPGLWQVRLGQFIFR